MQYIPPQVRNLGNCEIICANTSYIPYITSFGPVGPTGYEVLRSKINGRFNIEKKSINYKEKDSEFNKDYFYKSLRYPYFPGEKQTFKWDDINGSKFYIYPFTVVVSYDNLCNLLKEGYDVSLCSINVDVMDYISEFKLIENKKLEDTVNKIKKYEIHEVNYLADTYININGVLKPEGYGNSMDKKLYGIKIKDLGVHNVPVYQENLNYTHKFASASSTEGFSVALQKEPMYTIKYIAQFEVTRENSNRVVFVNEEIYNALRNSGLNVSLYKIVDVMLAIEKQRKYDKIKLVRLEKEQNPVEWKKYFDKLAKDVGITVWQKHMLVSVINTYVSSLIKNGVTTAKDLNIYNLLSDKPCSSVDKVVSSELSKLNVTIYDVNLYTKEKYKMIIDGLKDNVLTNADIVALDIDKILIDDTKYIYDVELIARSLDLVMAKAEAEVLNMIFINEDNRENLEKGKSNHADRIQTSYQIYAHFVTNAQDYQGKPLVVTGDKLAHPNLEFTTNNIASKVESIDSNNDGKLDGLKVTYANGVVNELKVEDGELTTDNIATLNEILSKYNVSDIDILTKKQLIELLMKVKDLNIVPSDVYPLAENVTKASLLSLVKSYVLRLNQTDNDTTNDSVVGSLSAEEIASHNNTLNIDDDSSVSSVTGDTTPEAVQYNAAELQPKE